MVRVFLWKCKNYQTCWPFLTYFYNNFLMSKVPSFVFSKINRIGFEGTSFGLVFTMCLQNTHCIIAPSAMVIRLLLVLWLSLAPCVAWWFACFSSCNSNSSWVLRCRFACQLACDCRWPFDGGSLLIWFAIAICHRDCDSLVLWLVVIIHFSSCDCNSLQLDCLSVRSWDHVGIFNVTVRF